MGGTCVFGFGQDTSTPRYDSVGAQDKRVRVGCKNRLRFLMRQSHGMGAWQLVLLRTLINVCGLDGVWYDIYLRQQ
jgi:hypothetical protein